MLGLNHCSGPRPRCLVTKTKLPNFLDKDQPPRKKRPFTTVLGQTFSHSLAVLLPENAATTFQTHISQNALGTLHYSKVHLKLKDILTGEFFTDHIKNPSSPSTEILMLSEGRPGIDNNFSLQHGILRLEVDKATFEKCGLQGTAIPSQGRKHIKARYAIEVNLRLPSMVKGKPGFSRILWACENVLNSAVTWLICDLGGSSKGLAEVLKDHHPVLRTEEAKVTDLGECKVPEFPKLETEGEYGEAREMLEWLTLAMSGSPRLRLDDDMDTYLSRYSVPGDAGKVTPQKLVSFSWGGLTPPDFAHKIFLETMRACGSEWGALTVSAFQGEAYTILVNGGHATTWECNE